MLLIAVNTVFWCTSVFVIAVFKLLVPLRSWRVLTSRWLMFIGERWVRSNQLIFGLTQNIHWDVRGVEDLQYHEWYLVVSNHRSWVDILVLQGVFTRRIPFLKFFIKQRLIWLPLLGLTWWAMDMPFMKRFSRQYLEKNPHMRGKDLEATRRACEKFATTPTSVINFVEGSRFTAEKRRQKNSPYQHLLPARAGGIAFVLGAMGGTLHSLLDVTIVYAEGSPSIWDLCTGRVSHIVVDVCHQPIEPWLAAGNYQDDEVFRARFQQWLGEFWQRKDERIDEIRRELES